uniref:Uncharacterized protein n=1 Tax=Panagrolaimus sp. ES5 TaxID=591445 RepID=A0AC34FDF1_9BILA
MVVNVSVEELFVEVFGTSTVVVLPSSVVLSPGFVVEDVFGEVVVASSDIVVEDPIVVELKGGLVEDISGLVEENVVDESPLEVVEGCNVDVLSTVEGLLEGEGEEDNVVLETVDAVSDVLNVVSVEVPPAGVVEEGGNSEGVDVIVLEEIGTDDDGCLGVDDIPVLDDTTDELL